MDLNSWMINGLNSSSENQAPQELHDLLNSRNAVLFLNFEWSGYTKMVESFI